MLIIIQEYWLDLMAVNLQTNLSVSLSTNELKSDTLIYFQEQGLIL